MELEFVFIATCHSEFVGKIFKEAGAKHVICINESDEVMDDSIILFTECFYEAILKHDMKIHDAFKKA